MIWPWRFIPDLDKTLKRFGELSIYIYIYIYMYDMRADQTRIWKCLSQDGKLLTKHMLTYDLLDPYEQISVKCSPNSLVIHWPSFRRCYFQMYSVSLKLWCLGFESWMTFVPRLQFSTSRYWFGKWLAVVSVTNHYLNVCWQAHCHKKMTCVWRRPFCPCQEFNQNTTTSISHNVNWFQTQNMKQYWLKKSGKGRNIILIRSEKGVTWS